MKRKRNIRVDAYDLYQLLVAECRYGYTRDNHLMPGGAFAHSKKYLAEMLSCDKSLACYAATQLVREAVDQLLSKGKAEEQNAFSVSFVLFGEEIKKTDSRFSLTTGQTVWDEVKLSPGLEIVAKKGEQSFVLFRIKEKGICELCDEAFIPFSLRFYTMEANTPGELWGLLASDLLSEESKEVTVKIEYTPMFGTVRLSEYMDFIEFCFDFLKKNSAVDLTPSYYKDYLEYKAHLGMK